MQTTRIPTRSFTSTAAAWLLPLAGCGYEQALEADPNAWAPPVSSSGALSTDAGPVSPACEEEPPLEADLTVSSADSRSHLSGSPCLEGCHEDGGDAELVFAVAGTLYLKEGSRDLAPAGSHIRGIGNTRLTADACGNFYAIESALESGIRTTQPWVQSPTFRRMQKPLSRVVGPGDCNQSGCHDFSSRLNSGIHF